ncbi:hypothetical protein KAJ41_02150 [Candidatus Parcubacteria bacterium]|nr:hypothetical protein [Candidatus Parcubacteria bacterium]
MNDNDLRLLRQNNFFNIKEKSEQNLEIRILFDKIVEEINSKISSEALQGRFVIIGRTNANVPAHLLFVFNN